MWLLGLPQICSFDDAAVCLALQKAVCRSCAGACTQQHHITCAAKEQQALQQRTTAAEAAAASAARQRDAAQRSANELRRQLQHTHDAQAAAAKRALGTLQRLRGEHSAPAPAALSASVTHAQQAIAALQRAVSDPLAGAATLSSDLGLDPDLADLSAQLRGDGDGTAGDGSTAGSGCGGMVMAAAAERALTTALQAAHLQARSATLVPLHANLLLRNSCCVSLDCMRCRIKPVRQRP